MAGQLIRRGDRTFLVRVYVGLGVGGKRKYISRTVHGTKKEADRVLTSMLSSRDLGSLSKPSRQTLEAHIDSWLESVVKARVKERTFVDYQSLAIRHINPRLGNMLLTQISPDDIQRVYQDLGSSGLSGRSIRFVHAVLRNALKFAVRWQLILSNPCDHVDLPKQTRKEMSVLSQEEASRFLQSARADRWYAYFLLLMTSGLRPSEALALRWSDIDIVDNSIRVERTLSGRPGAQKFESPKTSKSRRRVPVPPQVIQQLQKLQVMPGEEDEQRDVFNLVFRNELGQPLDLRNLGKRHFKPILTDAGLPSHIRVYDLRHTCATLLLLAGENPKVVAERLGHSSIVLTLDTYSHVLPDMQRDASRKLERMLL